MVAVSLDTVMATHTEGQWANDLHHGKGIFTTADGQAAGMWHEGEPE